MKSLSLSTKIFLVSGLILLLLGVASFGILYQAQSQLITREMDTLLESETLALSALVDTRASGEFDFEMSPFFFSKYERLNPSRFFRFINPRDNRILRQSPGAPTIECQPERQGTVDVQFEDQRTFRIKATIFRPEIESGSKSRRGFEVPSICLVVGVDKAPYRALVFRTLLATIPVLVLLVVFLIGILLILVRRMTRDLSRLTSALETADFGATHEFPSLPDAHTIEVKAVAEKLVALHAQAADVYRDMWLFLGRAAHQLKTPVAAMQATLQVLLRKERSKEELLSGLSDVEEAAGQLSSLTRKLISSSRISYQDVPEREVIDLHGFVLEQIRSFIAQAEQRGVVLKLNSQSSPTVRANHVLLSEIFGNLIENAILYSPQGAGALVSISWVIEDTQVIVLVSDRGKGFPAQVREALFKPFVRGDERQVPGSGLGLSIAKKAALLLGGDIVLQKTSENGSTFAVTLPLA